MRVRLAAMTVLLAACAADGPATVTRVELGTGMDTFTPLPPTGSDVELVRGPQGGWHLTVAARVWLDDPAGPDELILRYEALRPTGALLGMTRLKLDAVRFLREGDHWLRLGDLLILDVNSAAEVVGMTLEISATAQDVSERKQITVVDLLP